MIKIFLSDDWFFIYFDIYERYDSRGQFVLWSLYNNNKFLILVWTNFARNFLLKFFTHRIFNKPAIEFIFAVFNYASVLICERQFFSIVLSKNCISFEIFLFCYRHRNRVFVITHIGKNESWAKNFSANKLSIINDVWIDVKNVGDVNNVFFFGKMRSLRHKTLWWAESKLNLLSKLSLHSTGFTHSWLWRDDLTIIVFIITRFLSMNFLISIFNILLVLLLSFLFEGSHSLYWRFWALFLRWTCVLFSFSVYLINRNRKIFFVNRIFIC